MINSLYTYMKSERYEQCNALVICKMVINYYVVSFMDNYRSGEETAAKLIEEGGDSERLLSGLGRSQYRSS